MGTETAKQNDRRTWLCAGLAVTVAWGFLSSPWLLQGLVIPWDAKDFYYPVFRFLAQSLGRGESPFWNPYQMAGYPAVADPQSFIFSPVMLLLALFDHRPSMRMVDGVELAHLLMGGLAVLGLSRSHGWRPGAAVAAAIVFMFGAAAGARLQHTIMIMSYSWLPVALLLLKLALDRPSLGYAAGFAVAAAIMATSPDQVSYFGCLILLAYPAYRTVTADRPLAFLRTRLPALVLAGVLGAVLLAVPVAFVLEMLAQSNRPSIDFTTAGYGSIHPINLFTFLFPEVFGSIREQPGYWGPGQLLWPEPDATDQCTNFFYIGALPALLILRYGVLAGWLRQRAARFYAIVAGLALLYVLGRFTPAYHVMYDVIPGVSLYRRPNDALFPLGFAMAMLTGFLLDRLIAGEPAPLPSWPVLGALGAAFGLATLLVLRLAGIYDTLPLVVHGLLEGAAVLALAALLLWAIRADFRRRAGWVAAGLLMLTLDLRVFAAGTYLNAHPASEAAPFDTDGDVVSKTLGRLMTAADRDGGPYRAEVLGLGGSWQNAPMVYGIQSTLGYNPLRLDVYDRATGAEQNSNENDRAFTRLMPSYRSTLADLLGIRYIVTGAPIEDIDHKVRKGDFTLLAKYGDARIYENPRALPRVLVASDAVAMSTEAILETGRLPPLDFRKTVILQDIPDEWTPPDDPRASAGTAKVESYDNTVVKIAVDLGSQAFVVLNDIAYRHWHAYLDGKEVPILTANVLFRAVLTPAGRHEIVYRFEPDRIGDVAEALLRPLHRGEPQAPDMIWRNDLLALTPTRPRGVR